MGEVPMILYRRRPGDRPSDATIEAIPTTTGRVSVRVSGRDVANSTSPDTIEGWTRTVAYLLACGWAP